MVGRLQRLVSAGRGSGHRPVGCRRRCRRNAAVRHKDNVRVASPVYDEAVRRQRAQRFLPSRIVGDLDTKTGRRQIKAVLFQERLASAPPRRPEPRRERQHHGRKQAQDPDAQYPDAQGPDTVDPKWTPTVGRDRPDDQCRHFKSPCLAPRLPGTSAITPRTVCQDCVEPKRVPPCRGHIRFRSQAASA